MRTAAGGPVAPASGANSQPRPCGRSRQRSHAWTCWAPPAGWSCRPTWPNSAPLGRQPALPQASRAHALAPARPGVPANRQWGTGARRVMPGRQQSHRPSPPLPNLPRMPCRRRTARRCIGPGHKAGVHLSKVAPGHDARHRARSHSHQVGDQHNPTGRATRRRPRQAAARRREPRPTGSLTRR